MQTTAQFKAYLESSGFALRAEGSALYVEPRAKLTEPEVDRIRREKAELLALLSAPVIVGKMPHFNSLGDLVISASTDPQFHYWAGGQTIWQTLADMDASAATIRRYAEYADVMPCKCELVELDGLMLCVECGFYTEKAQPMTRHAELVQELGF